jgi:hypothetical protein
MKIIQLGVFKPDALHPFSPAPIKALACLCISPHRAEKSKPPALRVVGDSLEAVSDWGLKTF